EGVHRHARGPARRRRHHHAALAERTDARRAAAVGAGVLQALRPDAGEARARRTRLHRDASRPDEPGHRDRIRRRRRPAVGDPRSGHFRHRRPHGGDEPSRTVAGMNMQRLSIAHGRVVDPASGLDRVTNVHVADGRIVAIGAAPDGFRADRTVDAHGLVVAPGLVDLAARLREPGFEYRATLESEMRAAVAGGITSLSCPPDTDPPLDEPGLVAMLKHRARGLDLAHLYPLGALTVRLAGEIITEMGQLAEAGCAGFSQALAPLLDTQVLLRAMQYANTFGFTVWVQPQDPHLARGGVAHAGVVAARLGLTTVPVVAETIAIHTILELVRETGCRVHLCRLSSAAGAELVRRAKAEGLPLTADVAVHHLHLVDVDIGHFDSQYRVDPPFRSQRDRAAIRAALADGTLDAICSDHTPVDDDAKQLPFAEAE